MGFTAKKGKKVLKNLSEFDARQYASIGGWKVTGWENTKKCASCGRLTKNNVNMHGDVLCTDCGGNIKSSLKRKKNIRLGL